MVTIDHVLTGRDESIEPGILSTSNPRLMDPLLEVIHLRKSYPTAAHTRLDVLHDISFRVNAGEVVAITGASGTGKSTLLHLLGGLDRPDDGEVLYQGDSVFAKDDEQLAAFRNRAIGFVFQFHHLLPEFTALENVVMPALIDGKRLENVQERALSLLEALGLKERAHHRPAALSGGEKQRVAVARALMNQPGLILADEPTGNLDTSTAETLHEEVLRLSRAFQQTFIIVTHNPALAGRADRQLILEGGTLRESV